VAQLSTKGFVADVVGSGVGNLEALTQFPDALVSMDCRMPELDGYDATSATRRMRGQGHRDDGSPARGSRKAAISSPLRTSRTLPTTTGWFHVLPSRAWKRATSVN
jgi:CheY-like chemotaxis protein